MRMIMKVSMPNEEFSAAVRDGSAPQKMKRALDAAKPEAAYFAEFDGGRTGILVVNIAEPSQIPAFAEPWFLMFNAKVELHPAMTAEDLAKAGLDKIAKEWG
jgi:hypothetical protein